MIVKGYKGVIDLDLTNVHPMEHSLLIKKHKQDIENYKQYQQQLPEYLRYENSIGKVIENQKYYNLIKKKKDDEKKAEENEHYKHIITVNNNYIKYLQSKL